MLKQTLAVWESAVILLLAIPAFAQATTVTHNNHVKECEGAIITRATSMVKHKPTCPDNHYDALEAINSCWQGQFGVKYNF